MLWSRPQSKWEGELSSNPSSQTPKLGLLTTMPLALKGEQQCQDRPTSSMLCTCAHLWDTQGRKDSLPLGIPGHVHLSVMTAAKNPVWHWARSLHLGASNPKCSRNEGVLLVSLGPRLRLTRAALLYKCIILKIYQLLGKEGKLFL